ncbi:2OG-Fe(II) oxygenase [Achromobacter mucicolens]|uniref:2OG-Fe(II) oxygenase n=1 Tax=Achromobacter mucicolens TaxID=1389922 RepID=UPI001CBA7124|nr:2OG-Fe(II) oxygenase [Achromobacter mucicolens]MDH1522771.1 2OG-Fe(II) oxygenase [Achromobacter mucicolens]UAN00388.1 2OG-Fe(II) oxygenase [Achromobacter mucicolens]
MTLTPADALLAQQDWTRAAADLDAHGNAILPALLTPAQCNVLFNAYDQDDRYRSRVVMARHGFGRGEYKYFRYPLPGPIARLRGALYAQLAPIANRWNRQMGINVQYPADHAGFLARCHAAGQRRPTPLILRYGPGDYNCLHQDLYGEHVFPLQVALLLSAPGVDFTGGEFVMTETSSREQRADVLPLQQGDALIFTVNQRPVAGVRGWRKAAMRHGVSELRSGRRHTLGIIFHDAV